MFGSFADEYARLQEGSTKLETQASCRTSYEGYLHNRRRQERAMGTIS
jgi:hypothetical protein